jgi:hypothetical protein
VIARRLSSSSFDTAAGVALLSRELSRVMAAVLKGAPVEEDERDELTARREPRRQIQGLGLTVNGLLAAGLPSISRRHS